MTLNWFAGVVIGVTFPVFNDLYGNPAPMFTFFAGWTFITLVLNQIFMVETKDKTKEEIYTHYDQF